MLGDGKLSGSSFRYGSAVSMNAFQISAGNVPPATGVAVELGQHRHELVRVADPDRGHELRRVADEPRVAVVLGRAGLARRPAGRRAAARACRCPRWTTLLQELRRRSRRVRRREHACARRSARSALAVSTDAIARGAVAEDRAVDPVAAVRERRVRARHLERVDRLGAEPDREVALQLARDPELAAPSRRRSSARRAASAARRPCCPTGRRGRRGRSARGTTSS